MPVFTRHKWLMNRDSFAVRIEWEAQWERIGWEVTLRHNGGLNSDSFVGLVICTIQYQQMPQFQNRNHFREAPLFTFGPTLFPSQWLGWYNRT